MNRIRGILMIPSYGNLGRFEVPNGDNLPFYSDLIGGAFAGSPGGDEDVALLDMPCVSMTGFCRVCSADRTGAKQVVYSRPTEEQSSSSETQKNTFESVTSAVNRVRPV